MKAITQKVTLAMARSCMNPQDLARAAGLPPQTINGVIRGRSVRPATLGKVARALGCDPAELVYLETETNCTPQAAAPDASDGKRGMERDK